MHREFSTPEHTHLHVEFGSGTLRISTHDTPTVLVDVEGKLAEEFTVHQDKDQVTVVAPRERVGFLGSHSDHHVTIRVPEGTDLSSRTGSAEVTTTGPLGACRVKSGSGDVHVATATGSAVLETGSGNSTIDTALSDLRVKAGSGDVLIGSVEGTVVTSTGSGSVRIGTALGAAALKAGSGDLVVDTPGAEVSMTTGSGDIAVASMRRGRFTAKAASGDVAVGIPTGTPVWTDIRTVSGTVHSQLTPVGEPAAGQDSVEVHVTTASGDVVLHQL